MSVAEDVLTGLQCSHCGVCFEEESGFPVLCESCYKEQKRLYNDLFKVDQERLKYKLIPKSIFKEL